MFKEKYTEIRTKYLTKEDCMNNCRDITRMTSMARSFSRKICGEVHSDGSFKLSSTNKVSNMFEFTGTIEERQDGIYMAGEIMPRSLHKMLAYIGVGMGLIFGIILVLVNDSLVGLIISLFPWINILIMKYSNSLSKDIIRKVSSR